MPNRNLHEIMGHIGRGPELRYTGSQKPVCTLSIATSNDFKRNGEWVKNPPGMAQYRHMGGVGRACVEGIQKRRRYYGARPA